MKPTLVIMAAGMGSRYGGIKQIDPMGPDGEIILDYSVHDAVEAGFGKVVFVIRRDIEKAFRETLGNRFEGKIEVAYAFQEMDDLPEGFSVPPGREKPWGTGQAILCCRNIVSDPFLVINADDFYGSEAFRVAARAFSDTDPAALESFLVGYRLENTISPHGYVTRGVCEDAGGFLTKVTERMKIGRDEAGEIVYRDGEKPVTMTGSELVSMNFWGFTPMLFEPLEQYFVAFLKERGNEMKSEILIPNLVDDMIATGRMKVKVLRTDASWFGVTYPEDKPAVKAALADLADRGEYHRPLWS